MNTFGGYHCPKCGRFVGKAVMTINGLDEVVSVVASCKKCGEVEPLGWDFDDFVFENKEDDE